LDGVAAGRDAEAAGRLQQLLGAEAIDRLLADAQASGLAVDGPGGLLAQMTSAVLTRALEVEMSDHLGYEKGDPAGQGTGNSRNGYATKTVLTTHGPVPVAVPRDRAGSFEPKIVPKHARRLGSIEDMVLSLYARGMTTRDIKAHLAEVYGVETSHETVAKITDVVSDEIASWQTRPVEEVYPILYIDAVVIKVRDGGLVGNKAAHLVIGVDVDGFKHVLGIWLQEHEGAKFWMRVLNDLRNRGLRDVLIVCCDGLTGLPEAIETVWPEAVVQTCVIHLIRNSMRFVSYSDRKAVTAGLRPVYTAVNAEAAQNALAAFERQWGKQYPGVADAWRRAWPQFVPFLDFPTEIRKVIYTTNAIESMNYQLRKITKTRGHFPNDEAATKLLYLGIRNITGRHIDGRDGKTGTGTYGWKRALNVFAVHFPGRLKLT
jgi:putative transposase